MSDAGHLIDKPVRGYDAFVQEGEPARLSAATILVCLGLRLGELVRPRRDELLPGNDWPGGPLDESVVEDWKALGVPETTAEVPEPGVRAVLRDKMGLKARDASLGDRVPEYAEQVFANADPWDVLALFESGLHHIDPLVRVASAIGYLNWTVDAELIALLAGLTGATEDPLVRQLALDALGRAAPSHPLLGEFAPGVSRQRGEPSNTSLLVHGTWARLDKWWQPDPGTFHAYLSTEVADLYARPDRFEWSGAWSDHGRALAAFQLERWLSDRGIDPVRKLVCHSHGGNVAMLATHGTTKVDQLVLLSCPIHKDKYLPDFGSVGAVLSIQARMDIVVLADGGALKFRHPAVTDYTLPVWFKHSASHDEEVWRRYRLPDLL